MLGKIAHEDLLKSSFPYCSGHSPAILTRNAPNDANNNDGTSRPIQGHSRCAIDNFGKHENKSLSAWLLIILVFINIDRLIFLKQPLDPTPTDGDGNPRAGKPCNKQLDLKTP